MDNIRIRAIEGERKGKGYAKDGERRRDEGGDRTREQERAPWKRTCKMVYEERPRRRRARGSAQLQLPFSSACAREGTTGARGARCWRSLSLPLSLARSLSFYLSLSVSPFRPGLTRACSPARRRCSGARQHSLTRNCGGARTFARVRATEMLAFASHLAHSSSTWN